jgi:thiamine-phosphate pyrophosphorylase
MVDLSLMLVTDPAMTARRGLIATVRAAVAGGVTIVQLRDKHVDDAALTATALALREALAPSGVPLIVNDRPGVAKAAGLAGVHVGQDDEVPAVARAIVGARGILGVSVTCAADLPTVDPAVVDYAGVGPVFASTTKADAAAELGEAALADIAARLPVPVVAIGGINLANVAGMIRAGAAGIAVVSAICAADDPRAAAADLREAIEKAR